MRRRALYILLAVTAYGAFLLATAPARAVLPEIALRMPPLVRIAAGHGTVWDGRFTLLWDTATGPKVLSRVRFRFAPAGLIEGRVGYAVRFTGPLHGHVRAVFGLGVRGLSDLAMTVPAGVLAALVPAVQGLGPGGVLTLRAQDLAWGPRPSGRGTVTWSRAALASAPVDPLGSYVAHFRLAGRAVTYRIRTLGGRLLVAGAGRYRPARGVFSFAGDVRGRGLRLKGMLSAIGIPDGRGGRRVAFRSSL